MHERIPWVAASRNLLKPTLVGDHNLTHCPIHCHVYGPSRGKEWANTTISIVSAKTTQLNMQQSPSTMFKQQMGARVAGLAPDRQVTYRMKPCGS
eukprot:8845956-Pyramimonas_sp.AAC.1